MNDLPEIVGSPAQVKWAVSIRQVALEDGAWEGEQHEGWNGIQLDVLRRVVDATWWIANRSSFKLHTFKNPSPQQFVSSVEVEVEPHGDAKAFAESASKNPLIAQLAILSLMARLYRKGPVYDGLRKRAMELYDTAEQRVNESLVRDLDGIARILKIN